MIAQMDGREVDYAAEMVGELCNVFSLVKARQQLHQL